MKRVVSVAVAISLVLVLLTGCSSAKLPGFGMTVKDIKDGALEAAKADGYMFEETSYEGNTETNNGVKLSEYVYTVNDYLYLYLSSSSEAGDAIVIALYADSITEEQTAMAVDEWLELVYGVLVTIDPQADWDEFDAMFIGNDYIEYHGYYYYYYNAADEISLTITPII